METHTSGGREEEGKVGGKEGKAAVGSRSDTLLVSCTESIFWHLEGDVMFYLRF